MIDKVEFDFSLRGTWIISHELLYNRNGRMFYPYEANNFTKNLGFTKVNQLLVTGPSEEILLDLSIFAQNITYHTETYIVDVDVASDQESSSSEFEESDSNDYTYEEELKVFSQEKQWAWTDTLENYKVLEKAANI
ncbi:hypothetical protein H5410_013008 [Solanum commersonii]|uniref:Uncharacterized protein n=1 Tax=Solanum commersonii TaxID=4109 RepID=A0A9J6ATA5_SOLCO|nr:hypothetical protein H5410_013008 [Solanum commersonii]